MSEVAAARPSVPGHDVNPWLVLVLVCMAQFMVILDATIVNVALPSIQTDLEMSDSDLQWVVNAYALVFGGFLLLGGRAGDLVGRKRIFLVGVVVFTIASLLNGLSTSSEMLIVCRGLQGLGAALVAPAALSIITTTFAEGAERAKAMSVWAAIAVGGGAVGLVFGGVLVDYFTWPWIFYVNIPSGSPSSSPRSGTCPSRRTSARTRHLTSREQLRSPPDS
jgi:MFS family permease